MNRYTTQHYSAPPLTTNPGPAKQTMLAQQGAISLVKRTGLWGSGVARGWFKTPSVGTPLENNHTT